MCRAAYNVILTLDFHLAVVAFCAALSDNSVYFADILKLFTYLLFILYN